jgi:ABC-2 type transport system permease protein
MSETNAALTRRTPNFWLPIWTLTWRELLRFFRQRTRIVGALGQPLIFWVLFGAGLRGSFQAPEWAPAGMSYQEYFFPGVTVMIVLFTAIFSTISIIEDRREGFLQGVLVAPVPRLALVLGKLTGGTLLALIQAALFLVIGPLLQFVGLAPSLGWQLSVGGWLSMVGFLSLVAFALTALGYSMAWSLDSTQGFHALMSVFLMPMWLLSGSFFPVPDSGWLSWVMRLNPLTYGVAGLRRLMSPLLASAPASSSLPSLTTCLVATCGFCLLTVCVAGWLTCRRSVINVR